MLRTFSINPTQHLRNLIVMTVNINLIYKKEIYKEKISRRILIKDYFIYHADITDRDMKLIENKQINKFYTMFCKGTSSISSPECDHDPICMVQFMVLYGHHVLSAKQYVVYFAGIND